MSAQKNKFLSVPSPVALDQALSAKWARALPWLLAAVTLALFWPVTGFEFMNLDDPDYFSANAQVQGGLTWAGFKWAWSSARIASWYPLTWL